MAESAGKRLYLSDTLKQTTDALTQLDTAAIERLLVQLKGVGSGAIEVAPESTESIVRSHKLLASVLSVTERNLSVLDRLHTRLHPQDELRLGSRKAAGKIGMRSAWEQ